MTILKVECCSNCHHDIKAIDTNGIEVCPICNNYAFETIEIDIDDFKCLYCKRPAKKFLYYPDLPFIDVKKRTYYCGCFR